jgi:hypothetical protein
MRYILVQIFLIKIKYKQQKKASIFTFLISEDIPSVPHITHDH